ncbi:YpiF family protein [Geomicrobium sediminis]|uniref:DUF2487 family protein n=2 Tax=Geomicrobium TaxID=767528 RepID=A0ABS2PDL0_9BACL|nr:YpiF family protein [Geomicrobium sediminis]MBM7633515.1 hypothetical protein [Geomicrobium sediminis]
MRFQTSDIDTYQQSKAYVDTMLVPLLPVALDDDLRQKVAMGEYISLVTMEMEKQFRGRLMQLPPLMYLSSESVTEIGERLGVWADAFKKDGKNHVIWMTSDPALKQLENQVPGLLLWIPHLPIEHLDPNYRSKTIRDQMQQLLPDVMAEWRKEDSL